MSDTEKQPYSRWSAIRKALQSAASLGWAATNYEVLSAQLDQQARELEEELEHAGAPVAAKQPTVLEVPAGEGYDPITVIAFDVEPGKGKLIIQCWGDAWTCFFGAIGERTLLQFVAGTEPDYLGSKFQANEKYAARIAAAVIHAARQYVSAMIPATELEVAHA